MIPETYYNSIYYEQLDSGSLRSARFVVPLLLEIIRPKSIIDVGCGTGQWLSVFRECGVENILGIDGDYVDRTRLAIPERSFRVIDLTKPFRCNYCFDLALCLEVAEHLPPNRAKIFVKSISRLAPVILFSAAVPGQGGTHHVNEQWPEYWRHLFSEFQFRMFDPFRWRIWHDDRIEPWYRQNLFLFIHNDQIEANPSFSDLPEVNDRHALMLVASHILSSEPSLRNTLIQMPHLTANAIKRRINRVSFIKILHERVGAGMRK